MKKEALLLAVALVVLLAINVSANKAPLIGDVDEEIIICESSALSYRVNITDIDSENLEVGFFPKGPFFVRTTFENSPITEIEIFSANLTKNQADEEYERTLFVSDSRFIDTRDITIKVLETNNPPQIEHVAVETIIVNRTTPFVKQITVTDIETENPEEMTFELSGSLDMEIDASGKITFTPEPSDLGLHKMKACVTDSGVKDVDKKMGICANEDISKTTCEDFEVLVIEENIPPTILISNSTNISDLVAGTETLTFDVYKFDPDGVAPDTYWYVDSILMEIDKGDSVDKFSYSFGCDVFGKHKVKALISDGLANDSIQWPLNVLRVGCEDGVVPEGRIGGSDCQEKWGCFEWNLCQDAEKSMDAGVISLTDYETIQAKCDAKGWTKNVCGFRIRNCLDTGDCNSAFEKPLEIDSCYFSLEPSCSDDVKNCHNDFCEFAIDCGGPCQPCETCSDEDKNQGEGSEDCGGPCHIECPEIIISDGEKRTKKIILLVILFLIIVVVIQAIRLNNAKKKLGGPTALKVVQK